MTDGIGWQPIPSHLRPYRDKLRVSGFDLVRVSEWEARNQDYEYQIYEINHIDEKSGQVFLNGLIAPRRSFSGSSAILAIDGFLELEAPLPLRKWLKGCIRETAEGKALVITTILSPIYGLGILGMIWMGNYQAMRDAKRRAMLLPRLLDKPTLGSKSSG